MGIRDFVNEKKWKKLKKDQWLILFLAGVLLLIAAVPSSCRGGSREDKTAAAGKNSEAGQRLSEESAASYQEETEKRLEEALSRIEGVGKVEVMITLKNDGETVVEKDMTVSSEQTESPDSGDSREKESRSEHSEETVYSSKSGEGTPFVSEQLTPRIGGILVIAQGGGNTETVKNISEAVQALFAVEAHKIKVVKMNSQEGTN